MEQDLEDMDEKMECLKDIISTLDDVILPEYTKAIEDVVNEWYDHTQKSIKEMIREMEIL